MRLERLSHHRLEDQKVPDGEVPVQHMYRMYSLLLCIECILSCYV
jgi:hypothetical protein